MRASSPGIGYAMLGIGYLAYAGTSALRPLALLALLALTIGCVTLAWHYLRNLPPAGTGRIERKPTLPPAWSAAVSLDRIWLLKRAGILDDNKHRVRRDQILAQVPASELDELLSSYRITTEEFHRLRLRAAAAQIASSTDDERSGNSDALVADSPDDSKPSGTRRSAPRRGTHTKRARGTGRNASPRGARAKKARATGRSRKTKRPAPGR
jgi:hypothetical protein